MVRVFDGRLRVISCCQPVALAEGACQDELLNLHAPRCWVPTFVSHADAEARNLQTSDREFKFAQAVHGALDKALDKRVLEVKGYPLFGKARRFDGAQYLGDHPQSVILQFIDEHMQPKPLAGKMRAPAALEE